VAYSIRLGFSSQAARSSGVESAEHKLGDTRLAGFLARDGWRFEGSRSSLATGGCRDWSRVDGRSTHSRMRPPPAWHAQGQAPRLRGPRLRLPATQQAVATERRKSRMNRGARSCSDYAAQEQQAGVALDTDRCRLLLQDSVEQVLAETLGEGDNGENGGLA
jgi:hypothetical protein